MDGRDRDVTWRRINRHRLSYEALVYRRYEPKALKPHRPSPVAAVDTETFHGECKLIADSFGNHLLDGDIDAVLSFLTHKRFRQTHVFAYNLQYDAEAILKLLPVETLDEIVADRSADYHGYLIKYIPKKLLTIRYQGRNTTRVFDIAQFFETSLDHALEKYLGLRKTDYKNRARLNTDLSVWEKELPEIIAYNADDAYKTGLLGSFLQSNIQNLFKFNPRSYISKASLAKDLVRQVGYVPNVRKIPRGARKYAFYSYKGGRFEVCQRGYFPDTRLYDINSAYPFVIRNLVDVTLGEWRKVTGVHDSALYGFYLCDVYVIPSFLCPLAYFLPNGVLCFPSGHFKTYLTKEEVEGYRKDALVEILHGWEFTPTEIQYPFRSYIDNLFEQKQKVDKKDYQYDLVKKMMNSLYGTFYEKVDEEDKLLAGILFNPCYASIITAQTRLTLYAEAKKHERDVIALQTDSVLYKGSVSVQTSNVLGGWQLENEGQAVVLQSGIYQLDGKVRTRGMQKAANVTVYGIPYKDVFAAIRDNPAYTTLKYSQERPLHLRECMSGRRDLTRDDINVWQVVEKSIGVNKDIKRRWSQPFEHGGDIFTTAHSSDPWHLSRTAS